MRIGIGYDVHRLVEGRPLVVGGIRIPWTHGPLAHSDGDVVCHAVADALLGALGLGDIGTHFPPGDPAWAGADSVVLLGRVRDLVRQAGHAVHNVDVMVVLEQPRLAPHTAMMRHVLAEALDAPLGMISIKATTSEGLGPIGHGEGLAAWAVATVRPCGS